MVITTIQALGMDVQRQQLSNTIDNLWGFLEHGGALTLHWFTIEELWRGIPIRADLRHDKHHV